MNCRVNRNLAVPERCPDGFWHQQLLADPGLDHRDQRVIYQARPKKPEGLRLRWDAVLALVVVVLGGLYLAAHLGAAAALGRL